MKSHLNVVLFSIGHFSRENYVAIWFSLHQGRKNQIVVFVLFYIRFGSLIVRDNLVATMLILIFVFFIMFSNIVDHEMNITFCLMCKFGKKNDVKERKGIYLSECRLNT
jgi:hypothetical protein